MRFGPTSLRLTSVLAKGLRRPKLRDDLKISEQVIAGESSCVIKIVETDAYARYGAFEYEILSLCDGARTAADITAAMNERHPDRPLSEPEVTEFLDGMDPNLWARGLGGGTLALCQSLEIDNLRDDSFAYLKAWLRRYVLRQEVDLPPASQRKRRIFLTFGLSASAYSVMLGTLVTMFAKNVFTSKFGNWGR